MSQIQIVLPLTFLLIAFASAYDSYGSGGNPGYGGSNYGSGGYGASGQNYGSNYGSGLGGQYSGGYRGKRDLAQQAQAQQAQQAQQQQQQGQQGQQAAGATGSPAASDVKFTPVRGPKQFSFNVADGIQGANQLRKEKWDNGTVTGMYANPLGNQKYQLINYIADDKGFRIVSTKIIDEADLMALGKFNAQGKKAQVDMEQDDVKTSWSVTPDQINSSKAKNQIKDGQKQDDADENTKENSKTG